MPADPIEFDINGLYILLSDIGAEREFHWGLYLALNPRYGGVIFHVVNRAYQMKAIPDIPNSLNLLLAVQIAVMDPVLHGPLGERLAAVPIGASPNYAGAGSVQWIKDALRALDDEGYIKLVRSVDVLVDEATYHAESNKLMRRRSVLRSEMSVD